MIFIFAAVVVVTRRLDSPVWWLIAIVAGHFFLFCNVFRIIRRREFIWAGLFILNVGIWAWFGGLAWYRVLACQIPVTAALIVADMRGPLYHGIFAKKLNSRLNDYLEERPSASIH
jgi:hypothetical protein